MDSLDLESSVDHFAASFRSQGCALTSATGSAAGDAGDSREGQPDCVWPAYQATSKTDGAAVGGDVPEKRH